MTLTFKNFWQAKQICFGMVSKIVVVAVLQANQYAFFDFYDFVKPQNTVKSDDTSSKSPIVFTSAFKKFGKTLAGQFPPLKNLKNNEEYKILIM